jgi:hypothetical protein
VLKRGDVSRNRRVTRRDLGRGTVDQHVDSRNITGADHDRPDDPTGINEP